MDSTALRQQLQTLKVMDVPAGRTSTSFLFPLTTFSQKLFILTAVEIFCLLAVGLTLYHGGLDWKPNWEQTQHLFLQVNQPRGSTTFGAHLAP